MILVCICAIIIVMRLSTSEITRVRGLVLGLESQVLGLGLGTQVLVNNSGSCTGLGTQVLVNNSGSCTGV